MNERQADGRGRPGEATSSTSRRRGAIHAGKHVEGRHACKETRDPGTGERGTADGPLCSASVYDGTRRQARKGPNEGLLKIKAISLQTPRAIGSARAGKEGWEGKSRGDKDEGQAGGARVPPRSRSPSASALRRTLQTSDARSCARPHSERRETGGDTD